MASILFWSSLYWAEVVPVGNRRCYHNNGCLKLRFAHGEVFTLYLSFLFFSTCDFDLLQPLGPIFFFRHTIHVDTSFDLAARPPMLAFHVYFSSCRLLRKIPSKNDLFSIPRPPYT